MDPTYHIIRILQQIVARYGLPTEGNLQSYHSLMYDQLVGYPQELHLLLVTLDQGLVSGLHAPVPYETLVSPMVTYLSSSCGIDANAARWAIDTWAKALGRYPTPPRRETNRNDTAWGNVPPQDGRVPVSQDFRPAGPGTYSMPAGREMNTPPVPDPSPVTRKLRGRYLPVALGILSLVVIIMVILLFMPGSPVSSLHTASSAKVFPHQTQLPTEAPVSECNLGPSCNCNNALLAGHDLEGYGLKKSSFRNADLEGANFKGATLINADFTGANLKGADLTDVMALNADFGGADMEDAKIVSATLSGANLSGVTLLGATIDDADFTRANLRGASLYHSSIDDASNFMDADLSGATWMYGNICKEGSKGRCEGS